MVRRIIQVGYDTRWRGERRSIQNVLLLSKGEEMDLVKRHCRDGKWKDSY